MISRACVIAALALLSPVALAGDWTATGPRESTFDVSADPVAPGRLIATTGLRALMSQDSGLSFVPIFVLDDSVQTFAGDPSRAQVVYSLLPGGTTGLRARLLRSTDGGLGWSLLYRPDVVVARPGETFDAFTASTSAGILNIVSHTIDTPNSGKLYLHRSTDDGVTWKITPIVTPAGATLDRASSLITPPGAPDTLLVAGNGGLLRSDDGGRTWEAASAPLSRSAPFQPDVHALILLRSMAANPLPDTLLATILGRVYRSSDGGRTWTDSSDGLSAAFIDALAHDPDNPGRIYAATFGAGVYQSMDAGHSWSAFNSGLPANDPSGIVIRDIAVSGGAVVVSTQFGMYRCAAQDCNGSAPSIRVSVIEFYNANLDHYFMTAYAAEAAAIDAGSAGPGWMRTGATFNAWQKASDAPADAAQVFRFYGTPGLGPNSHFYTASLAEFSAVRLDPGWSFEVGNSFWVPVPSAAGKCPSGSSPVYRAYNNRYAQNDSNHRYSTSQQLLQSLAAKGWSLEGVAFCALD